MINSEFFGRRIIRSRLAAEAVRLESKPKPFGKRICVEAGRADHGKKLIKAEFSLTLNDAIDRTKWGEGKRLIKAEVF